MTRRRQLSKVFLSLGGFPERGTGRPDAVAVAGLASSLSGAICHYFHYGSSFRRDLAVLTTPEKLPSFHERGQAPSSFHRVRRSFRLGLIDWRYRGQVEPLPQTK